MCIRDSNNLVRKGYITKERSLADKREYHLDVTEKYMQDYGITYDYMNAVSYTHLRVQNNC